MIIESTKVQPVRSVTDIICNKCGQSCMMKISPDSWDFYGIEGKGSGGYYSKKFEDGSIYEFHLCETCALALFETFKLNPQVNDDPINFES